MRESGTGSLGRIFNVDAICYINSVLQILKASYLLRIKGKKDSLAASITTPMYVIHNDKEVANKDEETNIFKALNTKFCWTTNTNGQANAAELMDYIFDWMNLPCANKEYKDINTIYTKALSTTPWIMYDVALLVQQNVLATRQGLFNNNLIPENVDVKNGKGAAVNTQKKRISIAENLGNLNLYKATIVFQLKHATFSKEIKTKQKQIDQAQTPLHLTTKKQQTSEKDKDRNYDLVAGFV
jgi:hypothetical protein